MSLQVLFYRFGTALFIGLLIGLQREYDKPPRSDGKRGPSSRRFAGIRTFPIFALVGCSSAMLAEETGSPWLLPAVLLSLTALVTVSYAISASRGGLGMTTEMAAILTALAGALCYLGQITLAVALAVALVTLLSFKLELHGLARKLSEEDLAAAVKFGIITAIILPLLPNRNLDLPAPLDVVNLYEIWLMVVLISGLGFLGYLLMQFVDARRGISLTGILGGLVSSTAVTLTFAQRSRRSPGLARSFALAICLGWTVMFLRILVEIGAVHARLLPLALPPIAVAGLMCLLWCAWLYREPKVDGVEAVDVTNPFELGPALSFGLLYGLILVASRAASYYFGNLGLYVSAVLSGIADVDAITLSMSALARSGEIQSVEASWAIALAAASNTVVKSAVVIVSGSASLARAIAPAAGLILFGLGLAAVLVLGLP